MKKGHIAGCVLAVLVLTTTVAPAEAKEGFLKHLDTLMRNYSNSFYAEGSPGDIAEKWFRGGPKVWFSLKEMDTTMKAYGEAQQKVGEQALADLKVVLKDLISFKTYLPGGLVDSMATLKARFLARCQNPWADDAGGGGASFGGGDSEVPAAGGSDGDGALPGEAAASAIRAPRAPSSTPTKKKVEDRAGMRDSLESFVGFRKAAQKAVQAAEKLDSDKKSQIQEKVIAHARSMEDTLVQRLSRNETAIDELDRYLGTLDPATAKGCFGPCVTKLVRVTNQAAMAGDAGAKARAKKAAALKSKVGRG